MTAASGGLPVDRRLACLSLAPVSAIAQNLPLSQTITLAVQDKSSSGADGFTDSTASNGCRQKIVHNR